MARLEPVAAEINQAVVCPVTGRGEEDEEENCAVNTWPVEEVGANEEEKDEDWGGVRWDKKKRQPATGASVPSHQIYIPTYLLRQNIFDSSL